MHHAITPSYVDGVNFLILGHHSINSIRKAKVTTNKSSVLVGNSLHKYWFNFISQTDESPVYAPGISCASPPALTLVELEIEGSPYPDFTSAKKSTGLF